MLNNYIYLTYLLKSSTMQHVSLIYNSQRWFKPEKCYYGKIFDIVQYSLAKVGVIERKLIGWFCGLALCAQKNTSSRHDIWVGHCLELFGSKVGINNAGAILVQRP